MAGTGEFRTDGGATWLNLLATRGQSFGRRPVERLPDPAAATRWLTMAGLAPADRVTDEDRAALVALRESLRELAMAAVEGRAADEDASRCVTTHAGRAGGLGVAANVPVEAALASLAVSALVTLRGPDRALLKECPESDCRWVFLDPSGRRRWCPSPACASRGRVRAHRAARSAAAPDTV